jgi:hypothetical protein
VTSDVPERVTRCNESPTPPYNLPVDIAKLGLPIEVSDRDPQPDDEFLCSMCLGTFRVRDLHVVPSFDPERGWSGAFRCPGDRAVTYEAARMVLSVGGLRDDELAGFLETVERWGPPIEAFTPFVRGRPLERAALEVLRVLEQNIVRLAPGKSPRPALSDGDGRPVFLMTDAVLACAIAPRGHAVDERLMPAVRAGEIRPVIVHAALRCAMRAVLAGDRIDVERWSELLRHAEMQRSTEQSSSMEPTADEIAHWREVVFGQ